MSSIVICEKPKQKAKIEKAVGENYGKVYAARGHIVRLAAPEEVNDDWKRWSTALLFPKAGEFPRVPSDDKDHQDRLARIKNALRFASVVYLATDSDGEGQLIGEEILEICKFQGKVLRVATSREDPISLREAFENTRDNAEFRGLYLSAFARQQSDQVFNLSITRALTVLNQVIGGHGVIGAGRVKTPTLAIACAREVEIREFKPQTYFDIAATFRTEFGDAVLHHCPKGDDRILEEAKAYYIVNAAMAWEGPMSVTKARKRTSPPDLFTMSSLQKEASRKFKWGAQKTLDTAQILWDADLITYPRASGKWLPEVEINSMPTLFKHMKKLVNPNLFPAMNAQEEPVIRRGKAGHFSDKELEKGGHAHHAIVPNVVTAEDWPKALPTIGDDALNLFNLIANRTLQALLPDYVYDSTKIEAHVELPQINQTLTFKRTGSSPVSAGWREVKDKIGAKDTGTLAINTTEAEEDAEEEENALLPPIPDKSQAHVTQGEPLEKQTTAPKRYSEGDLIDLMKNSWKFVSNPQKQERLKESEGIGTEATRASIIEGLKNQEYLHVTKGQIYASDAAVRLFSFLRQVSPHILSPGLTAEWDMMFGEIRQGRAQHTDIISSIAHTAGRLIEIFEDKMKTVEPMKLGAPPKADPKILERAKALSQRTGVSLPAGSETNTPMLIQFLRANDDREKNETGGFVPSAKALEYGEKLANWLGVELPQDARRDAATLNTWIEQNKAAAEARAPIIPPSEPQMALMQKIMQSGGPQIPPEALVDSRAARKFLDKNASKMGAKRGGKRTSKRRNVKAALRQVFT